MSGGYVPYRVMCPALLAARNGTRMTGRILQRGGRWLAGFLAIAAMVGWSVGVPNRTAGKDACPPERAAGQFRPGG